MKILIAHVSYEHRGGEDVVVETEATLLRAAGYDVSLLVIPSSLFRDLGRMEQAAIAASMGDHSFGRSLIRRAIAAHQPDVVHFHNLYPLFGPGAIREAAESGCATVHTIHSYRMSCIAGTHYRSGGICERCRPGHHAPGVLRACYRESLLASFVMARGVSAEWSALTRDGLPHMTVCLTDFMRRRLLLRGLPAARSIVKPNSVHDGGFATSEERDGVCLIGRLSVEKGVLELLGAWTADAPPLKIIGDGPLREAVVSHSAARSNIEYLGPQSPQAVRGVLRQSLVGVMPSRCFEGAPLVLLEALSEGTPIVAFDHGAMTILGDVSSELLVPYGDFGALVALANRIHSLPSQEWTNLSVRGQGLFQQHYTDESNIRSLEAIYSAVRGAQ